MGGRRGESGMTRRAELTIDDLLSDPLTLSLMAADGVDPVELRSTLRLLARRLEQQAPAIRSAKPGASGSCSGDLLRDCIHFAEASSAGRRGGAETGRLASRMHRSW